MALKASGKCCQAMLAILLLHSIPTTAQTTHRRLTGLIEEPDAKHSHAISFDFNGHVVNQEGNNTIQKNIPPVIAMHMEPTFCDSIKGTCTTSYPLTDGNKGVSYKIVDGNANASIISFTIGPVKYKSVINQPNQQMAIMTEGVYIFLRLSYQKPEENIWVGTYSKNVHGKETTGKIVLHERKDVPAKPVPKPAIPKMAPAVATKQPVPAAKQAPATAPPQAPSAVTSPQAPDTLYAYQPLYRFSTSGLKVSVWDNYHVDGEVVRLHYGTTNEDIKLTADKQGFTYYLPAQKVTILTLTMINEGTDPGNTVSITFSDGAKDYSFEVNGHAGQSFTYYFWRQ